MHRPSPPTNRLWALGGANAAIVVSDDCILRSDNAHTLLSSAVSASVLAEDAIVVNLTKSPKAIGGVTRGAH